MNIIREDIKKEVVNYGYSLANLGTFYIIDSFEIVCKSDNPIKMLKDIENNIYKNLAKKYKQNWKTIKSNIVNATNNMNNFRCSQNENGKILRYSPKMVIGDIADKVKCIES